MRSVSLRFLLFLMAMLTMPAPLSWADALEDLNNCLLAQRKGEHDNAIRLCTKALGSGGLPHKAKAHAYNNRCWAYLDTGRNDKAIEDCSLAIQYDPYFVWPYINRCRAFNVVGRHDEAIEDCSQAIGIDPSRHLAYLNRGNAYLKMGRCERAAADYDRIIRSDAKIVGAYNNKAWLLATCPDPGFRNAEEAVRLAEKAVAMARHPYYLGTMAAAYAEAGRFGEAVQQQEKAIALLKARGMTSEIESYTRNLERYRNRETWRE